MIQERDKYLKDRRKITSLILHGMTFAFFLTNVDVLLAQFKFQIEASSSGDSGPVAARVATTSCIQIVAATQFREVTKPAYLIGTHLVPGHERELAYLVVAKHKYLGEETAEFPVEASAKDGDGRIQQAVVFGDIRLSLEYKLSVDCHYSNVKKEELTINGVALDLSKGRVVYVDLTKRVTDLTQIEWQFRSSDVQGLEEAADVAERIRRLVDDQVRKGAVRKRTISLRCGSPRLTSPPER